MNNTGYTEAELQQIYNTIALYTVTEMILATAFILMVLIALATVFKLRKIALALLILFGAITFFIPSGYTLWTSPAIAVLGVIGLSYEFFFSSKVLNHANQ